MAAKKAASKKMTPGKHDGDMARQATAYLTHVQALTQADRAAIQKELDRIDAQTAPDSTR